MEPEDSESSASTTASYRDVSLFLRLRRILEGVKGEEELMRLQTIYRGVHL
jgi:hypothetical protein